MDDRKTSDDVMPSSGGLSVGLGRRSGAQRRPQTGLSPVDPDQHFGEQEGVVVGEVTVNASSSRLIFARIHPRPTCADALGRFRG
jgi:hypothetical protein